MKRPNRTIRRGTDERGQTLVEFALVFPIFFVLLMGMIEFGLVFNALLSINFASRDGSLIAAEAGNAVGSDCVILEQGRAVDRRPVEHEPGHPGPDLQG